MVKEYPCLKVKSTKLIAELQKDLEIIYKSNVYRFSKKEKA